MIRIFKNGQLVYEIDRESIEFYLLFWELNYKTLLFERGYLFLPPRLFTYKDFRDGIWYFECENGFWFIEGDKVFVLSYDELVSIVNEDKVVEIEWMEVKKEEAWWMKYVPVENQFGYSRKAELKVIDEDIVKCFERVIEKYKKKRK